MSEELRSERVRKIEEKLRAAFEPLHLEIVDESALHAGHPGARSGGGHFRMTIVSAAFSGKPAVDRQRLVYAALSDLLGTEIHALSMRTMAPEEWGTGGSGGPRRDPFH
ncbi:MAG: cell division protein BolA [Candidatus Binatia bacterium]|nr:MAG: cell division protein BolA [Candidatus Binatia bacterium]